MRRTSSGASTTPARSWTSRKRRSTTASCGASRYSRGPFVSSAPAASTGTSGSCSGPSSWRCCCSEWANDDRRAIARAPAPRDDPPRAARAAVHRHHPEDQGQAPVPAGGRGPSAVPRPHQAVPQGHGPGGHGLGPLSADSSARAGGHGGRGRTRSGRPGGTAGLSVGRRVAAPRAARVGPLPHGGRCARRRRRVRRHGGIAGDDGGSARRAGLDDGRVLDRGGRRDDGARGPRGAARDVVGLRLARVGLPRLCGHAGAAPGGDGPHPRGQPGHPPRAHDAARRDAYRALRAGAGVHGACITHPPDRDPRPRVGPLLPDRTGKRGGRHGFPSRGRRVRGEDPCARDLPRARRVVLRQASAFSGAAVPRHRLRVRPHGARAENPVSAETVRTIIDDLGALLLFTMILILAAGQIYRAIYAVAAQSFLIAIAAAVLATATGNTDLWVIAGITLTVKTIVLPWVLHRVVRRMSVRREVVPVIPVAATLALAVMVVVMSFHLGATLGPVNQAITGNALPVGIALTLLGVLVMATGKTALNQMVGLFASENGIFFTAMAVTQGMPLIIEIGVILDVILAVLVMA